jgi:hypothetical protein
MGPDFMRMTEATADIQGRDKIVRPEFGTHLPAVPMTLLI